VPSPRGDDRRRALMILSALTLQNVPEGFVAAVPLLSNGLSRGRVAAAGAATGLVEPPAAFAGYAALTFGAALLPFGMGFAAAAMIYVVVDELPPECFAPGHERVATLALLSGFLLMMALDAAFG
jgi:zinc transporter, ZIP family